MQYDTQRSQCAESETGARRSVLRSASLRLSLIVFGTLLGLLSLELGLRAAAWAVGGGRPTATRPSDGELVVLALGDSHTYGVGYSAEEAYPGQLQALFDRRAQGKFQVTNLGLPGMNSSEIALRLEDWIERYHADVVLLCVGLNNVWNRSDVDAGAETTVFRRWFEDLRTVRLVRLLKVRLVSGEEPPPRPALERIELDDDGPIVEFRDSESGEVLARHERISGRRRLEFGQARQLLVRDLERMLRTCNRHGTELVLLTYSCFPLPGREARHVRADQMSDAMRRFASERGLEIIDTRSRFLELLPPDVPRDTYFRSPTDGHPNPRGYAEIARMIADRLHPEGGEPNGGTVSRNATAGRP